MTSIIQSEAYKGYTINIVYTSEYFVNPREDWDNLGVIYSNHRDYNPDNHRINELLNENGRINYDGLNKDYVWLPVSCYEHGGITFWCGTPQDHYDGQWDCSIFGIIAAEKSKVLKEWGWKILTKKRRERIESILEGEIKTLAAWCEGEVYGFEVYDEDDNMVDSCHGYIGNDEIPYMISEGKAIVDNEVERREEEEARVSHMESIIDLCWAD